MKWNNTILPFYRGLLCCVSFISLLLVLSACTTVDPVDMNWQKAKHMSRSAKRGVAFNFAYPSDLPLLSPYITWDYNWGNTTSDISAQWFDANGIDYCPMCWNGNYDVEAIRNFVKSHPNTKYLLAFNEPNLKDQARLTPAEAASLWQPVVQLARELNLQLVSPAMNYGTLDNYGDPIKWLDEFFTLVDINDVAAISVHCYMSSVGGLKSYIDSFRKYNKPVWLTEFCAWDPKPSSEETQLSYISSALQYLEQEQIVARYAWFIPRYNGGNDPYMRLITKDVPGELTPAGRLYCGFSTFDTNTFLSTDWIPAGSYASFPSGSPEVRPATDALLADLELPLMITNAGVGQTMTYNLSLPEPAKAVSIRTAGYTSAIVRVSVGNSEIATLTINPTGSADNWVTTTCTIPQAQQPNGLCTVKLEWLSGNCLFSAFSLR